MDNLPHKQVEYLIVDTSAFIQNAPLHEIATNIVTCQDVINEITSKRQLKRLVVLPYDLVVKEPHTEHIKTVTDFAMKTGDYPSLSATDIKVMALTYQLETEHVGSTDHLRTMPIIQKTVVNRNTSNNNKQSNNIIDPSFYASNKTPSSTTTTLIEDEINVEDLNDDDDNILVAVEIDEECSDEGSSNCSNSDDEKDLSSSDDDDGGWITPSNIKSVKKSLNSGLVEEKRVTVACLTMDFAMQNVLKQINLNVSTLDGRIIKQLRTFILRCYACFKTTSIMTKQFCPKCGNDTLKKVAVSVDADGNMQIHINGRRPLTGRGKKFSLPRIRGGKHPNNPILVADQPQPDNKPSRLAKTKTNPLDDDYIAGMSPFVMRDVTSKSAQLHIRPCGGGGGGVTEIKYWMRKNPNEVRRHRKRN